MMGGEHLHPVLLVCVLCFTTQIFSVLVVAGEARAKKKALLPYLFPRGIWRESFWVNIFTFLCFVAYFWAIGTPLGAGLNSLVSFGADPLSTAFVSIVLFGERLTGRFLVTCVISLTGILLIGGDRRGAPGGEGWIFGLTLSLASTLFYAVYVVFLKRMMAKGFTGTQVTLHRFYLCTVGTAVWALFIPMQWPKVTWPNLMGFSFLTFTIPVWLFMFALKRLEIQRVAVLMFLNPVITLVLSSILGKTKWTAMTAAGTAAILGSLFFYEATTHLRSRRPT